MSSHSIVFPRRPLPLLTPERTDAASSRPQETAHLLGSATHVTGMYLGGTGRGRASQPHTGVGREGSTAGAATLGARQDDGPTLGFQAVLALAAFPEFCPEGPAVRADVLVTEEKGRESRGLCRGRGGAAHLCTCPRTASRDGQAKPARSWDSWRAFYLRACAGGRPAGRASRGLGRASPRGEPRGEPACGWPGELLAGVSPTISSSGAFHQWGGITRETGLTLVTGKGWSPERTHVCLAGRAG